MLYLQGKRVSSLRPCAFRSSEDAPAATRESAWGIAIPGKQDASIQFPALRLDVRRAIPTEAAHAVRGFGFQGPTLLGLEEVGAALDVRA